MSVDRDTFEALRKQDESRVRYTNQIYRLESQIRECLMFLESDIIQYDRAGNRAQGNYYGEDMSRKYNTLLTLLERYLSEDQYNSLVDQDRTITIPRLVERFGRKGLPRRLNDSYYEGLHPTVRSMWGIRTGEDHSKF